MDDDKHLTFDDDKHQYHYQGIPLESVTQFLKRFVPLFEKEKWSAHVAKRERKTQQEVLHEWEMGSKYSRELGIRVHSFMEGIAHAKMGKHFIMPPPHDWRETMIRKSALNFWSSHPELIPISPERRICVPTWKLGGTIDLMAKTEDDNIYLVDWKTNKTIDTYSKYGETLIHPLSHLDNCNFHQYGLQLSLYAYMLEKRYGYRISGLYLVHLTEDDFYEYTTPYYKEEIDLLIKQRLQFEV